MAGSVHHVIVNPMAGNGRTRKEWPRLQAIMEARLGAFTWEWTEGPGHATHLALEAIQRGCGRIWSVGGDGTHHEVGNALLSPDAPPEHRAVLAPLSRGTGSDLARSLGLPREPEAAIEALVQDRAAFVDAGWFRFRDPGGRDCERVFLNITSLGIGGEVDLRVNRASKALGGFFSFLWATLATLLTYRPRRVRYVSDGRLWQEDRVILIAVANGQYFGGGMWVAPMARLDDGAFDVVVVRAMPVPQLIAQLGKLYRGTHLSHPKVETFSARTVAAESPDAVWLDVDGEPLGTLPVEFRVLPRAIRVLVGPGFRSAENDQGVPG